MVVARGFARRAGERVRTVWRGRGFIAEACIRLVFVRLALMTLPLKRQASIQSFSSFKDDRLQQNGPATEAQRQQVRAVGWAVTRLAARLPIGARCLAQALAARAMLRRRGIASTMHIGVARPGATSLEAHAWLEAAGVEVIGYPVPPRYREIGYLHGEASGRH